MRSLIALLCLLCTPAARATTIPTYGISTGVHVELYGGGNLQLLAVLDVPWIFQATGHIDSDTLQYTADSITGSGPTEPVSFDHHPSTVSIAWLPWTFPTAATFALEPLLPANPTDIEGGIVFASQHLGTLSVIQGGTTIGTGEFFGRIGISARCQDRLDGYRCDTYPGLSPSQVDTTGHEAILSAHADLVPEPSLLGLFLLALAGMLTCRAAGSSRLPVLHLHPDARAPRPR